MPATEWGWRIEPAELESWIVHEDDRLLVVNKPGLVVCHPSKHGPWSSLIGACRERLGVERLHMPSRLDRETSGVVVFARDRHVGRTLQGAVHHGKSSKTYLALMTGELIQTVTVDQPVGREEQSQLAAKQCVRPDGQPAVTRFEPLACAGGHTLALVRPLTGRLHQIRVHAAWIGHYVAGDKLYGPDERLFLTFLRHGFNDELERALRFRRQMLHALRIRFEMREEPLEFIAPPVEDFAAACRTAGLGTACASWADYGVSLSGDSGV